MRGLDARVPPVVVFLVAMAIVAAGEMIAPGLGFGSSALSRAAMLLLLVLGGIFGCAGVAQVLSAGTTVHPNHPDRASVLVTGGIFRLTRNPMYLGLACLLAAYGAHRMHVSIVPAFVLFVWFITRFQIIPEERALAARFGAGFHDYAARVRRWL